MESLEVSINPHIYGQMIAADLFVVVFCFWPHRESAPVGFLKNFF